MEFSNILSLLCGVALFLFGMSLMGDGLKKLAGERLEFLLNKLCDRTWKGILLGTGVTAIIQSSSATSVMTVGFVNAGMMKFRQAIGIVLGAILGTSITGWILCLSELEGGSGWVSLFSTSTLTGVIAVVGIICRMFGRKQGTVSAGDVMLGFAVLMVGMSTMSAAVSPLKESPAFVSILTTFSNPILGVIAGAVFTSILQSASAAVGILQALTATGALDFATALPLIMGIAIGAAVPVLLSALGAEIDGKRTAFIYLLIDTLGAIICGSIFYILNAFLDFSFMSLTMTTVTVALTNTLFRLAIVIALSPIIGLLEKIACTLIRDKVDEDADDDGEFHLQLEERFLPYPALAISQCRTAINEMADAASSATFKAMKLLTDYSDERLKKLEKLEKITDVYEDILGTYIMKITSLELSTSQNADVSKFLHTISDFERIADHALNVGYIAQEIHEKNQEYSPEAKAELKVIREALAEVVESSFTAFKEDDFALAARVEPLEEVIDELCDELKLHHINRVKKGICNLVQGFTFNDLITNYERISDHCSNIALAMFELNENEFNTHEFRSHMEDDDVMGKKEFEEHFKAYREKYSISKVEVSDEDAKKDEKASPGSVIYDY